MSIALSEIPIKEEITPYSTSVEPVLLIPLLRQDDGLTQSQALPLPQMSSSTSASTNIFTSSSHVAVEAKVESTPSKFPPISITATPNTKINKSFSQSDTLFSNFTTPPLNTSFNLNNNNYHSFSAYEFKNMSNLANFQTLHQNNLIQNASTHIPCLTELSGQKKQSLGNSGSQFQTNIGSNTSTLIGEESELVTLINHIFSHPYLFFHTPNMHLPDLKASQDDIFQVFSFMVPNKPIQGSTSTNNSQFHKKQSSSNNYQLFSPNQFFQDKQEQIHIPHHNKDDLNSVFHNQKSCFLNEARSKSPNGFQKSVDKLNHKRNNKNPNPSTQKMQSYGLTSSFKEDKKQSVKKGVQSLVDLIKQQSQPEEQKRKKVESISSLTNLGGFKSSQNFGSLSTIPLGTGLSESSIASLLNLTLNPITTCGNTLQQVQNVKASPLSKQEKKPSLNLGENMEEEDQKRPLLQDSNDREEGDDLEDEDDSNDNIDRKSEDINDEEACLIRQIKELKEGNGLFSKNFKEDGGLLFEGDENEDDIFGFYDDKFMSSKKLKKNYEGNNRNKFDTKNLVKNFLNSFISFAHHPEEEGSIIDVLGFESNLQLNDFRLNLRNFFKGKKFNRVLLREFIFEDIFRPLFLFFLENRALIWIQSGRMKDKSSHLRALKNFIFVCQNYDQIKSWRFRYNFVQNE